MTSTDPYTRKASEPAVSLSPKQKIDGLHKIIKATKSSMLTTRGVDGFLHSRAMAPASCNSQMQQLCADNLLTDILADESLHFTYIANNTSSKFVSFSTYCTYCSPF